MVPFKIVSLIVKLSTQQKSFKTNLENEFVITDINYTS